MTSVWPAGLTTFTCVVTRRMTRFKSWSPGSVAKSLHHVRYVYLRYNYNFLFLCMSLGTLFDIHHFTYLCITNYAYLALNGRIFSCDVHDTTYEALKHVCFPASRTRHVYLFICITQDWYCQTWLLSVGYCVLYMSVCIAWIVYFSVFCDIRLFVYITYTEIFY